MYVFLRVLMCTHASHIPAYIYAMHPGVRVCAPLLSVGGASMHAQLAHLCLFFFFFKKFTVFLFIYLFIYL